MLISSKFLKNSDAVLNAECLSRRMKAVTISLANVSMNFALSVFPAGVPNTTNADKGKNIKMEENKETICRDGSS